MRERERESDSRGFSQYLAFVGQLSEPWRSLFTSILIQLSTRSYEQLIGSFVDYRGGKSECRTLVVSTHQGDLRDSASRSVCVCRFDSVSWLSFDTSQISALLPTLFPHKHCQFDWKTMYRKPIKVSGKWQAGSHHRIRPPPHLAP